MVIIWGLLIQAIKPEFYLDFTDNIQLFIMYEIYIQYYSVCQFGDINNTYRSNATMRNPK